MRLLLTSGGITNPTINDALVAVLGRPISECSALAIPTAQYGQPMCTPLSVRNFIAGAQSMCNLGWKSVGVLELTAIPTMGDDRWIGWVRDADVLLVDGGEATYLCHWLRQSGLADLLPSLSDTAWVGLSAGSMVVTPRIGEEFVDWPAADTDRTLGLVDFSIFPHLDYPGWTSNSTESARRWAAKINGPAYAIDDATAISVIDGQVEVHSEGNWQHFDGR